MVTLGHTHTPVKMGKAAVAVGLVLLACVASVAATAPIAPMMYVRVEKGTEVVLRLAGYDRDGGKLTARITALPESGTLYQLSQVFSDYGYNPKRGAAIKSVAGAGEVVTGSKNRLVYTPPANTNPPPGKWARFTYTIHDGTTESEPGYVWLVPPHGNIVASGFSTSKDGWHIMGNGARAAAKADGGLSFEAYSRGLLNHYVLGTDAEIHVNSVTKDDDSRWYFHAPAKFLGNHVIAYGGEMKFSFASASGDFSPANLNSKAAVVVLDCASCARGAGIRLAVFADKMLPLDGTTRSVSIKLTEDRWLKDPKNTLLEWQAPTNCEMVEVLSGLTGVKILGDHTRWYESIALDDVVYTHGNNEVPVTCAHIYH